MTDQLKKERRQRFLENLIKEGVINTLAEQELPVQPTQSAAPPAETPPAPETNAAEQQPQQGEPTEFTVELMVDKLNVIRGGRSLDDPEVFGKLTTFFNDLTSEQRASFNYLLTELGRIVVDATEDSANLDMADPGQQQTAQSGGATQVPPKSPAPAPAAPPTAPTL